MLKAIGADREMLPNRGFTVFVLKCSPSRGLKAYSEANGKNERKSTCRSSSAHLRKRSLHTGISDLDLRQTRWHLRYFKGGKPFV
jgi:hypothetical protein